MGGSAIAGWRRRKRRVDGTLSAHRTREESGDLRDVLENRIGYSSHDAAIGVAWLMQSDVVPPGAELVYYEHPDFTYARSLWRLLLVHESALALDSADRLRTWCSGGT